MNANNIGDLQYLCMVKYVLDEGILSQNRTGQPAYSIFDYTMKFDLSTGRIPVLTTKKIHLKSIIHELIWFLKGDTNIKYLNDNGVTIWDEWADANGDLGPVYGEMWRNWDGKVDQIKYLMDELKNNPDSRRLVMTGWNPSLLPDPSIDPKDNVPHKQALPPCHCMFQMKSYIDKEGVRRVDGKLIQRSADVGLGVPFNIAQYSMLLVMFAKHAGIEPGTFIWSGGDVHIYANHVQQLSVQLEREAIYDSPKFEILNVDTKDITEHSFDDFVITDYQSYSTLKMPVSV